MRLAAAICVSTLALAGCMPTDGPLTTELEPSTPAAGQSFQTAATVDADEPADEPTQALLTTAFAPIPPKRPDFEGVTPASRSLGAVVADAEQVDDQLEKQAAAAPSLKQGVQTEARVRIVALNSNGRPAAQVIDESRPRPIEEAPAATSGAVAPVGGPGNSPGYYAAYEDTDISCFPQPLRAALNTIASHYGQAVEVTSGMRHRGRAHSMHRYCMAADIRIEGVGPRELADYAKTVDGINGVGTYRYNTVTHIDIRQDRMAWRY